MNEIQFRVCRPDRPRANDENGIKTNTVRVATTIVSPDRFDHITSVGRRQTATKGNRKRRTGDAEKFIAAACGRQGKNEKWGPTDNPTDHFRLCTWDSEFPTTLTANILTPERSGDRLRKTERYYLEFADRLALVLPKPKEQEDWRRFMI